MTRGDWSKAFLGRIGAPITRRTMRVMLAWIQAENTKARCNPLATTQSMPNASDFNSVGVKNYVSLEQGLEATVKTLNYGADRGLYGYGRIRYQLRKNFWAVRICAAIIRSQWGTGYHLFAVLNQVMKPETFAKYRDIPIPE
jgi:hypothetical protein